MNSLNGSKWRTLLALISALVLCATLVRAQKLAIRSYQVSDGLAHGGVTKIHQDAKGYLWIATNEGLSRFDGYRFTNYGSREGLGNTLINDVVSDRQGRLWVATNGAGVARLLDDPAERQAASASRSAEASPAPGKKFTSYLIADGNANYVNKFLFDAENCLWCVTDAGLYRARSIEVGDRAFEQVAPGAIPYSTNAAFADSRGRLWFGVNEQVIQVVDAKTTSYILAAREVSSLSGSAVFPYHVHSVFEDERGRVLAADGKGVYEFIEPTPAEPRGAWRKLSLALPPAQVILVVRPAKDGGLWLGTTTGLIHFQGGRQRLYTTANGLSANIVNTVSEDREGNLWIGTSGGLCKLAGEQVLSYTTAQGLPFPDVHRLAEDREGRIYASVGCNPRVLVEVGDGQVSPLPLSPLEVTACAKAHVLQDARGNWWFRTARGLAFSFGPKLDPSSSHLLNAADGLFDAQPSEIYEDAEGKVWLINIDSGNLYVTEPQRDRLPRIHLVARDVKAEIMARDSSGTLWLGDRITIRRWMNNRWVELRATDGLPAIEPRAFFQDSRGRMWIGLRYNGVSMTADPNAEQPRFVNYSTANGLASDTVWAITEDDDGRIYLGTGRGLDQLDVATGKVRHFTVDDGVAGSVIHHLLKDRRGQIWIASDGGISKLNPRAARPPEQPPPVFISRVQVAGEDLPVPETGAHQIAPLELQPARNNIAIQFVGLSYQAERTLKYQYKLEGVDLDWSAAGEQREVNYARLAPGRYRFVVRAIIGDDVTSAQPAVIEFHILRPIYLRWWFIALAALGISSLAYALYRYRVARVLEVANMRTRIATDLHDDIGANLTKIAILSEVAKQQLGNGDAQPDTPLSSIAGISRESVAAMGDIV